MRLLKLPLTTTGSALFALDLALVLLVWPLTLWVGRPGSLSLFAQSFDIRLFTYPLGVLLVLYAMGLYRRDALLEPRKTATRIPLVVGMGGVLAILTHLIHRVSGS